MQLSVIIVSYNVRFFLEQCLLSVQKAVRDIHAEIIVIDNHSTDGTQSWLPVAFPHLPIISNDTNLGFAKACNQGLARASGEYVLFLNPDTLVPEEGFRQCLDLMQDYPDAGALGVRMVDGKGRFLPESKRAYPSLQASFFKLSGLAKLFPGSAFFNKYALGQLDPRMIHEVDVLAGAFMLTRRTVLEQLNGFDERFFLYGEDIDLSFRIRQKGFKNLYNGETTIIHFKGESSASSQLSQLKYFYQSMVLFVRKHYTESAARRFTFLVSWAIAVRGAVSYLGKIIKPLLLPATDFLLVWIALQAARAGWITRIRGGMDFHVPAIAFVLPALAFVFVAMSALAGLYDRYYKTSRALAAVLYGMIAVLAVYAVLPESIRFSRGVILSGILLGAILVLWFRQSLFMRFGRWMGYEWELAGQTLIVANESGYAEVAKLFDEAVLSDKILGRVCPVDIADDCICTLEELPSLLRQQQADEIVFCEGGLKLTDIISEVQLLSKEHVSVLYHIAGSSGVIGSDLAGQKGRSISGFIQYRLAHPYQRRMKRLVDIKIAFLFLLFAPLHFLLHPSPAKLLRSSWQVLGGKKTWVAYRSPRNKLPPLRTGVIAPPQKPGLSREKSDAWYARNYDWWQDAGIILNKYRMLA